MESEIFSKRAYLAALKADTEQSKAVNTKHREDLDETTFISVCLNENEIIDMEEKMCLYINSDTSDYGIDRYSRDHIKPNSVVKCKGCEVMLPVYKQPSNGKITLN